MHRTLKFCRYLRDHGWRPVVLTVTPSAYAAVDAATLAEVPPDVPVYRSLCLDASRHLSVAGRYPGVLALPDRWVSWWPSGVVAGLRAIRRWRPEVIWSTYPVATAHLIGAVLARLSGLPWVADFRDWMTDGDYPDGPLRRRMYRRVERSVLSRCDAAIFTTDACRGLYRDRYPSMERGNWLVLPNGYDEADFGPPQAANRSDRVLLHSGYLYPTDRDPTALFAALATLRRDGHLQGRPLSVLFRAPGDAQHVMTLAARLGVDDLVRVAPPVSHREAVAEMQQADALLLLQGARFARQVPAKAYEYLRAGRPVLTLAPPASASAQLMGSAGLTYRAELDAPDKIALQLRRLMEDLQCGRAKVPPRARVERFERRRQAGRLADIFDSVTRAGALSPVLDTLSD